MKNASSYCNYNEAFKCYDRVRQPVGISETIEVLKLIDGSVEDLSILEGGFGTGACTEIIRHYVKEIFGVEGSEEGCKKACSRLGEATNVHLMLGNILSLPFKGEVFDAYMVHQVVHHLDPSNNFEELRIFLEEAYRVLKPGGVIVLNTCSPEHVDPERGVFWNYRYIYKAARELQKRYIPINQLMDFMESVGFSKRGTKKATGRFFAEPYYSDPLYVTQPDFPKGDSVYCFLSEEEIEMANYGIKQAVTDGSVFLEMKRADRKFQEIGEAIIVYGIKP